LRFAGTGMNLHQFAGADLQVIFIVEPFADLHRVTAQVWRLAVTINRVHGDPLVHYAVFGQGTNCTGERDSRRRQTQHREVDALSESRVKEVQGGQSVRGLRFEKESGQSSKRLGGADDNGTRGNPASFSSARRFHLVNRRVPLIRARGAK